MEEPWQPSRSIVRTGCMLCLSKAVPCKLSGSNCARCLTAEWSYNPGDTTPPRLLRDAKAERHAEDERHRTTTATLRSKITLRTSNNWRERHGLQFFVDFTAPQIAGSFYSFFWQGSVIRAASQEPAVYHALVALGLLHESVLRVQGSPNGPDRSPIPVAALEQCNKSIRSLTARFQDERAVLIIMAVCVIFTTFEAMQGRQMHAISHALQGLRLLKQAVTTHDYHGVISASLRRSSPIPPDELMPVVYYLAFHANSVAARPVPTLDIPTPPLPTARAFFRLDEAQLSLRVVRDAICALCTSIATLPTPAEKVAAQVEKLRIYRPWLDAWEAAFSDFLARRTMHDLDLKRAMVIKANHLFSVIMTDVDMSAGQPAFEPYTSNFQAIAALAKSVLGTYRVPPVPTRTAFAGSYLSYGMWLTEPLYLTASRCFDPEVKAKAAKMLREHPRQEALFPSDAWRRSAWTRSASTSSSQSTTPSER